MLMSSNELAGSERDGVASLAPFVLPQCFSRRAALSAKNESAIERELVRESIADAAANINN